MDKDLRKNLKAAMQASKAYTDRKAQEILWKIGEYDITTQTDNTSALVKTAPSGATRVKIKRISGNCVKYAPSTASDDSVAKDKVIPENTYTTELNTLGGMSYKSENLCNIVSQSRTTQGITWNIIGDEISVQWDGTGVSNGPITLTNPITLKKGTYTSYAFDLASSWIGNIYLRGVNSLGQNVDFSFASANNTTLRGITKTLDEDITFTNLWCSAVNVTSKYTFKIMIVRGSTTPTEYKPYFDGIRDSAITSVISKDSNNTVLQTISIPSAIQQLEGYGWGINDTCYNYIDFNTKKFAKNATKYTITSSSSYLWISESFQYATLNVGNTFKLGGQILIVGNDNIAKGEYANNGNIMFTFKNAYANQQEMKDDLLGVIILFELATPIETDISSLLPTDFNKILTNDNYTDIEFISEYGYDIPNKVSYYGTIKETLCTTINKNDTLAVSLTNNEAKYGWSVGSIYNTRDYTTIKGGQKVGRRDLGTLDYILSTSSGRTLFKTTISDIVGQINTSYDIPALCSIYNAVSTNKTWVDKDMAYTSTQLGSKEITFVNNDYSSASAFKAAMSGVYLYYELATEVVEDITPLDNNVIEVVENDELEFVNSENQSVPSEITYRIEVEK